MIHIQDYRINLLLRQVNSLVICSLLLKQFSCIVYYELQNNIG